MHPNSLANLRSDGPPHPNSLANLCKPWEKGVSANPGGRPKGASIMARIEALLLADDGKLADILAKSIVHGAMKGDVNFCKELLNRLEGRVPIKAELTGKDGDPIEIRSARDDLLGRIDSQVERIRAREGTRESN